MRVFGARLECSCVEQLAVLKPQCRCMYLLFDSLFSVRPASRPQLKSFQVHSWSATTTIERKTEGVDKLTLIQTWESKLTRSELQATLDTQNPPKVREVKQIIFPFLRGSCALEFCGCVVNHGGRNQRKDVRPAQAHHRVHSSFSHS